jgi:hypothetical protein
VVFRKKYFLISLLLLIIEIFIASQMHDSFIRPYVGDFLAVILLYCIVKTFLNLPPWPVAGCVLLFSYFIECLQYMQLADRLQLRPHSVARILLGDYFTWTDILAYTLGISAVLVFEKVNYIARSFFPRANS